MTNLKKLPGAIQFALFASVATLVSGNVVAQETETNEAKTLDRVEVTGSRLKRAEIEGALPVVVIDRATIDASGDVSVADVLRDSTFASFGNFKPQSGSSAQSLASVDLRGLGSGRTLVLIDGRRAPTNPMSASSGTDLNAIPLAAVERIEILSDGASAIYGSDAIGGVVNIILRKDFNGAELRYGVGQTKVTGGDLEDGAVTFGISGDRGSLIGGASFSSRGMVFTRDQIGGGSRGVSIYGNNFYDSAIGRARAVPGFACNSDGFYMLANGRCSFDFNSVAANEASVKNKSVFTRGEYEINDDWSVYMTANVTKVNTFGRYAPVPGIVRVEDGSPQDIYKGDGAPTYFYHRFAAAGNRDGLTDTTNTDFLVGFQGQLNDKVSVDFGIRRTDYKYGDVGRGYVLGSLANAAANNGSYNLSDPFGADPAVLQGFTVTISRDSRFKTEEIFGSVNFDLFEMGGGVSNAVVGAEYRDELFYDKYDSLSESGTVLGSAGNSSGGTRNVYAAYFEWLFPFTSSFDITLAGRYDKYSDYGADFSPKIAARWQPLDNLTFRASYGQGFRAPQLDILTQKLTFSAEPVTDDISCVAGGDVPGCSIQVDSFSIANPSLSSEQSKQYGFGVVYDPTDWLDMSLDYYNIEVEDSISQYTAQNIVDCTRDPATYGACPAGLGATLRPDGSLDEITTGYANRGLLKTSGLDFRLNTDFDFGGMGKMRNNLMVSYIKNFEVSDLTGRLVEQTDLGGAPDLRINLANTWEYGDFSVGFNTNFIGSNGDYAGYATNDVQFSYKTPWNARISVGANNVGDRYPELIAYSGRPWNFYLYDAYGRTTYFRYVQTF
ncbi:TonB-dependent receptor [Pseudoxanthomonas gei]|uniref:TonB-dependent receptor n=1 Tax=Pseudoxanthomonas gei TaxID=1383030 RepID=A0ABX0ABH6_9GAMM|nr:TonB-dependent receptor [Pseudoxanthomonas gei]NDK38238.1 TonB-dependent receptor [Pseudoxanthomonas gei]